MGKNNQKSKVAIRKWIILGSFLALFIVCVFATYIVTYNKNKKSANDIYEGSKFTSSYKIETADKSKIKPFDFTFYCSEIVSKDEMNTLPDYTFKAYIANAAEGYTFTSVKYQVSLGNQYWSGAMQKGSAAATTIASTFSKSSTITETVDGTNQTVNKTTEKTYEFKDLSIKYPQKPLLFVQKKKPTAYVNLTFNCYVTTKGSSTAVSYNYLLAYTYGEYVTSKTILN